MPRTRRARQRAVVSACWLVTAFACSEPTEPTAPASTDAVTAPSPSHSPVAPSRSFEINEDGEILARDFELVDHRGRRFRLADEKGKVVVLFFGYAHCPDVCPTTLSSWARIEAALGALASQVTFAFVTVDPERDTSARLAKHLGIFSEDFLGLRGTTEQLDQVYDAYRIDAERVPVAEGVVGYVIDHTTRMFVIDPRGVLHRQYDYRTSPDSIAGEIGLLLEQVAESGDS